MSKPSLIRFASTLALGAIGYWLIPMTGLDGWNEFFLVMAIAAAWTTVDRVVLPRFYGPITN